VKFVIALLKGLDHSRQVEELSSNKLQLSDIQLVTINSTPKPKHTSAKSNDLVLINSAYAAEIAKSLEGIGDVIAQGIVSRRKKQGHFKNF